MAQFAVTGASGFIGRHLCAHLHQQGHPVRALSRRETPNFPSHVIGDYADTSSLAKAFAGVDSVIHLAARAHQNDPLEAGRSLHHSSVLATKSVVEACHLAGVRRLVFVSSIGVLGNRSFNKPLSEEDAPAPVDAYARSKLEAEDAVRTIPANSPTDFVIIRPPLVYGPGCPGNFGMLLRLAMRSPVVPLGAIRAPRRFIAIDNLVDALRVAALHPAVSRQTYVVADALDVTVAEIVRWAAQESGRTMLRVWNVPPMLLQRFASAVGRADAIEKLCAPLQVDHSAFTRATGWEPKVMPDRAIREAASALT